MTLDETRQEFIINKPIYKQLIKKKLPLLGEFFVESQPFQNAAMFFSGMTVDDASELLSAKKNIFKTRLNSALQFALIYGCGLSVASVLLLWFIDSVPFLKNLILKFWLQSEGNLSDFIPIALFFLGFGVIGGIVIAVWSFFQFSRPIEKGKKHPKELALSFYYVLTFWRYAGGLAWDRLVPLLSPHVIAESASLSTLQKRINEAWFPILKESLFVPSAESSRKYSFGIYKIISSISKEETALIETYISVWVFDEKEGKSILNGNYIFHNSAVKLGSSWFLMTPFPGEMKSL